MSSEKGVEKQRALPVKGEVNRSEASGIRARNLYDIENEVGYAFAPLVIPVMHQVGVVPGRQGGGEAEIIRKGGEPFVKEALSPDHR